MVSRRGIGPGTFHAQNIDSILQNMAKIDSVTINDLSGTLGLSRTAVKNILNELETRGLVIQSGKGNSTTVGGKKATLYSLNPECGHFIYISFSTEYLLVELDDFSLQQRDYRLESIQRLEYKEVVSFVAKVIDDMLDAAGKSIDDVKGVSLAASAMIDSSRGLLIDFTGNNEAGKWGTRLDIVDDLSKELNYHGSVYLDSFCSFSGYYAACDTSCQSADRFMYFLAHDNGIGAAFISDGEIENGRSGIAGEIGHTTIQYDSCVLCRCGRTGCFEAMLYPTEIRKRVEEALNKNEITEDTARQIHSIEDLFKLANDMNSIARCAVEKIAEMFANLLYNVQIIRDPDVILFHDSYKVQCSYFHQCIEKNIEKKAEGKMNVPVHIRFYDAPFSVSVRKGALLYIRNQYLEKIHGEEI